jgi:predicted RNase H-like HicB family nuclease
MPIGELANVLNQESVSIKVWREKDGIFVAKCLDIPGCISQGATRQEALANIDNAIAMCLDVIRQDVESNIDNESLVSSEIIQHPISGLVRHA